MQFSAMDIATIIGGQIEGDKDTKVTAVAKIEEAKEGALCFLSNSKYLDFLHRTQASVVLINQDLVLSKPSAATLIRVPDAYASFAKLLQHFHTLSKKEEVKGIEQPCFIAPQVHVHPDNYIGAFAYISDGVQLGMNSKIYPNCFIGKNVCIGNNVILYPGVRIYDDCVIGDYCIIHAGTVIGSDGFGFAPQPDGTYQKIPQIGNVVLEDYVEIGANCTIDRATMGTTLIKKGAKLDNLIQIAHNVEIGSSTVIAAQTGIAGSSKIGKNCLIGGQVGIVGHIHIADYTGINAQSGVSKNVDQPYTKLNGTPAFDYKSVLKSQAIFRHLPDLQQKVVALEQKLINLTKKTKE